jgi:hypothetical protein
LSVAASDVRRVSFFLHKGCEQAPAVNSEEEEEEEEEKSPPSYLLRANPQGYVMLAQANGIPREFFGRVRSRSLTEMSSRQHLPDC